MNPATAARKRGIFHIEELIGGTPLLRMRRVARHVSPVEVYAKAEWFNPGGSVKDRPALFMLQEGVRRGQLTRDKLILDSTSGNTGIAYAWIGAALGYQVELVVPENVSFERKKILASYGAKLIFSDPLEGSDGAQRLAQKIYQQNSDKYFMPDQYNNTLNPQAHYETTGPEIWEQTDGEVTHFVAGIGTSGTLMGTGRRLKELSPQVRIVGVEPKEAMHGLEGLKNLSVSIVPGIFDESLVDERVYVATEDAYAMAERLSREEGLLVGHSSGAALAAGLALAERLKRGVVVVIFPDGGDRYLSLSR